MSTVELLKNLFDYVVEESEKNNPVGFMDYSSPALVAVGHINYKILNNVITIGVSYALYLCNNKVNEVNVEWCKTTIRNHPDYNSEKPEFEKAIEWLDHVLAQEWSKMI